MNRLKNKINAHKFKLLVILFVVTGSIMLQLAAYQEVRITNLLFIFLAGICFGITIGTAYLQGRQDGNNGSYDAKINDYITAIKNIPNFTEYQQQKADELIEQLIPYVGHKFKVVGDSDYSDTLVIVIDNGIVIPVPDGNEIKQ